MDRIARLFLIFCELLLISSFSNAQTFENLDFSRSCDTCGTGLANWDVAWSGKGTFIGPRADTSGDQALVISNSGEAVGFVEQIVTLPAGVGPFILSVSARVRTIDAVGKGAGLNLGVYDRDSLLLMSKDMGFGSFSWVTGTQEWRVLQLKILCTEDAGTVRLGAILYGQGEAWFDDHAVSIHSLEGRKADPKATAYVQAACDTIARHSLHRDSIDLRSLQTMALRIAGSNDDPSDHHLAVEYMLAGIEDHHSFLMKPEEVEAFEGDGGTPNIEYANYRVIENYGYLSVPGFASGDSLLMLAFADTIQQALALLDEAKVTGWVIDLRENTGGNMAPMITGLGPLFDPGTLGQLIDVEGKAQAWYYRNGEYGWDGEVEMRLEKPTTLKRTLPIAVLWSQRTGSSGECTAISFIGNGRTRSFGQPTWGLTTGNGNFDLPDGARMFLASTVMADRHGNMFHGPITPDVVVEGSAAQNGDATLEAALEWIRSYSDR